MSLTLLNRVIAYFLRLIVTLGLSCATFLAHALVVSAADQKVDLVPYVQVLLDPTSQVTYEDITAEPTQFAFHSLPAGTKELSLGFTDAAYWIRIDLSRQADAPARWILEVPFVAIDHLEWFSPSGQPSSSGTMGDIFERQIFNRFHSFYVDLSTEPSVYYLRVQSSYPLTVPLQLMRTEVFGRSQLVDTMVQSLYYGGLLSLFFYNLVIFFTNRDRRYLLYCLFTLCVGFGVYAGNGYGRLFLWPDWASFDRVSQGFFLSLAAGFGLLFTMTFLALRQRTPRVFWLLSLCTWLSFAIAAGLLVSVFAPVAVSALYLLNFSVSTFAILVCIGVASFLALQGIREAGYFVLSWGFLALGAVVATLRAFNLIDSNVITLYAMQISSGFEALLFSFALADRLRSERQARELAQRQLVESQQETVRVLRVSEERLEQAVDVRTQELRAVLVKEQQLRDQYVRFGAMIAHEFRNPLNVIEAQNALFEIEPDAPREKVFKRVGVIRSAVTRLSSLFDQWLQSDRLSGAFAQISPLPIDAIGLLDDVVQTTRSYQPDHRIVTYTSESPLVIQADYALLRIALLNLVDNACKYSPVGSLVCLGVELRDDWVGLFVKDEGCGIPLDKQKTIFETYVRLSDHEQLAGVGLGLAFVKRIAELHEGHVQVHSRPGHGATFTLWIKRHLEAG